MNCSELHPVDRAAAVLGITCSALAARLGVTNGALSQWKGVRRVVPINKCVLIEAETHGQVRRWHLRPHDWFRIWPELIGADGAPGVAAVGAEADGRRD